MGYEEVFTTLITLVVGLAGAPIIQLIRNGLAYLFKKPVDDRWALLIAGIGSGLLAALQMFLVGELTAEAFTVESFPTTFFAVFGIATIYYQLFKKSPTFLGQGLLLKRAEVGAKKPE